MHEQARKFTLFIKEKFPQYFTGKKVLDVGSGDINGNNRFLFDAATCQYEGNDVFPGRNVTLVCKTSALPFVDNSFDTIVSTECFEHDPDYQASFRKIVSMLKPGGLFFFTCASTGRAEHGTRRTTPDQSLGAFGGVELWQDHYKNLTVEDLDAAVDIKNTFSMYASYFHTSANDLYFWGIKKDADLIYPDPSCVQTM